MVINVEKNYSRPSEVTGFSVRIIVEDFHPEYNPVTKIPTYNALEYLALGGHSKGIATLDIQTKIPRKILCLRRSFVVLSFC